MLRCSAKQTARSSTTVRAVFKRENLNIRSPLEKIVSLLNSDLESEIVTGIDAK
jgi:hypothetical protein